MNLRRRVNTTKHCDRVGWPSRACCVRHCLAAVSNPTWSAARPSSASTMSLTCSMYGSIFGHDITVWRGVPGAILQNKQDLLATPGRAAAHASAAAAHVASECCRSVQLPPTDRRILKAALARSMVGGR